MKNEKLARAISDIDDELIEEAHGDMLRRRMPLAKKLTAVAACFIAVLFTAVVWHRITAVGVSVYGLDIAERGSVMLAGDLPDKRMPISTYALDLQIPLTVSTVGSCNIGYFAQYRYNLEHYALPRRAFREISIKNYQTRQ